MFSLSIMIHGQINPVVLRFSKSDHWVKCRDRASACVKGENPGPVLLTDDYDGGLSCLGSNVLYVSWQDVERAHVAEGDTQIIAAHANADLQARARGDTKLQASARMMALQQSGGVIRS